MIAGDDSNPADVSTRPVRRNLLPTVLGVGVTVPAGLVLNYAMNVVLGRLLPVDGYGVFAYVQSLAALLAVAAALGASQSMMRFVAAYRSGGQSALLHGLMRGSLTAVSMAAIATMTLLWLISYQSRISEAPLHWVALLVLPLAISLWRESSMRGLHRTMEAILPRQVLWPLLMLVGIWIFPFDDVSQVLLGYFGIVLALELVGLARLRQALQHAVSVPPKYALRSWLRASVPMGITAVAVQGMLRWDVVIVGAFVGFGAAGEYAAAARTAILASLFLRVVNLIVGPTLAELYHRGQYKQFRRLLVVATFGAAVVGTPPFVFAMIYPEVVLGLFGPEYTDAIALFQILAIGQYVNLLTGPASIALNMSKHETTSMFISILAAIVSLCALTVIVPAYGAIGAAVSVAATNIFLNVALAVAAYILLFRRPTTPTPRAN